MGDAIEKHGHDHHGLLGTDPHPLIPIAELHIKVFPDTGAVTSGDQKFEFMVTRDMDGMILLDAEAFVTTTGGVTEVQIHNVTHNHDMLSSKLHIDSGERNTVTSSAPMAVNPSFAGVLWGDHIRIDVDLAGSGAKGLGVTLWFMKLEDIPEGYPFDTP